MYAAISPEVDWRCRAVLTLVLLCLPSISVAAAEPMSVRAVAPGGAAEAAGLEVGDVLLELAGRGIATLGDLEQVLGSHEPNQSVPVRVARGDREVALTLTLGERLGRYTTLGASFAAMGTAAEGAMVSTGLGRRQCLAWVDESYRLEATLAVLEVETPFDLEAMRTCVARDVELMREPIPYGWCDNVFKVHCSGLDLLAELGEEQVSWCEKRLDAGQGLDLGREPRWTDCAADRIFERYSRHGLTSNEAECRAAFDACTAAVE